MWIGKISKRIEPREPFPNVSGSSHKESNQGSRQGSRLSTKKVNEAIEALEESFAPVKLFDVKKLKGMGDTFRIRLGDWRLIYEFNKNESMIIVYEIAPRGGGFLRRLAQDNLIPPAFLR